VRVRTVDGLDVTAALGWAAGHAGPITRVRELHGGITSTMLALTNESGEELVLRLMTREPWRTHGSSLTTREREILRMLAGSALPTPTSYALDAEGLACGHPAHLMSLLPGRIDVDRADGRSLDTLAELLAAVHQVPPTDQVRTYESWAWEAKYAVPPWATDASLWQDAFALLRAEVPRYEPCFIHRDFQPRNVLWSGDQVSGLVDWVETSIGPAWLDVAHCSTNIAITHGSERADSFAAAYVDRTGREPQAYFDVMDIVGFLPPPGRAELITEADERRRLEERLHSVMQRT